MSNDQRTTAKELKNFKEEGDKENIKALEEEMEEMCHNTPYFEIGPGEDVNDFPAAAM